MNKSDETLSLIRSLVMERTRLVHAISEIDAAIHAEIMKDAKQPLKKKAQGRSPKTKKHSKS